MLMAMTPLLNYLMPLMITTACSPSMIQHTFTKKMKKALKCLIEVVVVPFNILHQEYLDLIKLLKREIGRESAIWSLS